MALRISISPSPISIIQTPPISIKKPISSRVLMLAQSHASVKNITLLQIRSSLKNKVFEDRSKGIVCYMDDNGEITCEGYDEGPRFHKQISILASNERDAEIIDLLQRCLPQIVDSGKELNHDHEEGGVAGQKDFNQHGFNSFY